MCEELYLFKNEKSVMLVINSFENILQTTHDL